MSPEKMVTMANQIASFFKTQPGDGQATRVADHINDFWEPRMRTQLIDHAKAGGDGLDQLVMQAMAEIRVPVA